MIWWIFTIIGFVVGAVAGIILYRLFYFPRRLGSLEIVQDKNDGSVYTFLRVACSPENLNNHDEVIFVINKH